MHYILAVNENLKVN